MAEIGEVVPEILKILLNPRWRHSRHLDLVQRLKLIGNISVGLMRPPAKVSGNWSSRARDITGFSKSEMAAILDIVQRLKLIRNISHTSIALTRRSVQFGINRSRRSGDIKDFSKSKMAAVRHFGSS